MSGKGSKRRISFTDPIHYCLHGSLSSPSFSLEPVQMCSEKKGTRETCHKMCSRKDEKHALIKTCESNPTTTSTTTYKHCPNYPLDLTHPLAGGHGRAKTAEAVAPSDALALAPHVALLR